jgi:hypothetical protein
MASMTDEVRSEWFDWARVRGLANSTATFASFTFPRRVHPTRGAAVFGHWLRTLGPQIPRAFWGLRASDRTAAGALHYHVLVVGLEPAERILADRAWRAVSGGFARVAPSSPQRVLYTIKAGGHALDGLEAFGHWPEDLR